MQEIVLLCYLSRHHLGPALAISHGCKAVVGYSMLQEVVDHALCTPLAQPLVVFVLASVVAVCSQFYGHVGVLVEQIHQAVQRHRAVCGQFGTVEGIEHIAYEHRHVDVCQGELQHIFPAHAAGIHGEFLLVVEVALAGAQHHVSHMGFHLLGEGTVASHAQFQVGAVVPHHIHQPFGQFVSVLLIYPTLHRLQYLGAFKRHDVVPSACVTAAGAEESPVVQSLKGHSEVISVAVHGVFQVLHLPLSGAVTHCLEDVQSAHARQSVA